MRIHLTRLTAAGFLAAAALGALPAGAQSRYDTVTLRQDTVIPVVLDQGINSATARRGAPVRARVKVDGDSYLGIPDGSQVSGVVQEVRRHQGNEPGVLDLEFTRLRTPEGRTYPLDASLIGLTSASVEREGNGRIVAKPDRKKDRTKFIGYGAGAGAILGALTRGGKIKLTDILLGAAAGYAYGESQKNRGKSGDVVLKPGTEFGLALNHDLTLGRNRIASRYGGASRSSDNEEDYSRDSNDRDYSDRDYSRSNDAFPTRERMGNTQVDFSGADRPFRSGNGWMLPVRPVLNAAGVDYRYDRDRKELSVSNSMNGLRAGVDSRIIRFDDGSRNTLDRPLMIRTGTLYAPVRFFEMATLQRAIFDPSRNTLSLRPRDR